MTDINRLEFHWEHTPVWPHPYYLWWEKVLQLAHSAFLLCDFVNFGSYLKVFDHFSFLIPSSQCNRSVLREFRRIEDAFKSRTEWAGQIHQLKGTSLGAPPLLGSFLIIPLKLAKMAGSPDAGACWKGGWPVVCADRPWRLLGVIVGLEKYSFNIFDPGIWSFFFSGKSIW